MTATPAPPPETDPDTARTWVEFVDPDEPAQVFRCDLTWLTSTYSCVFGAGCPGIDTDRPADGCCLLGAHFTEDADREHVRPIVESLGPDEWQYRATGLADGWTELEDGDEKTRVVDGACIMLNRADFPTGAGCALHQRAVRDGVDPWTYKPEVCWQIPLRRAYREVELADGTEYLEITIAEYDRRHWGPGGHDFDWWCTGSPLAHAGSTPLYLGSESELRELMGDAAYEELARHCEAHLTAARTLAATPEGRALLPLMVHPATLAAHTR